MGQNADATGIHFRLLNRSKGASAQAPRVQCDKKAYQFRAKGFVETAAILETKQANVTRVRISSRREVHGVETDIGIFFRARSVVITSGTFLRGLLHVGQHSTPGGRMADTASGLSENLRGLGFEVGRFKTGTPCRIAGRSINFTACERQQGEREPTWFSFVSPAQTEDASDMFTLNRPPFHVEQRDCWITRTTAQTHKIITANLASSPLYSGRIQGTGPRYCPSIEDKVVKFSEKSSHQIFLEPEGMQTDEFYVNGVSTSLPVHVQYEFIQSIPGLEKAEIVRPGYAVEYDYFPPTQLSHSLETRLVGGLFFAGQVNGTSGYEEAAAQGLLAGANAALRAQSRDSFILQRDDSYIGVMIDDLVTKGTDEPYRMFTSRSENRLSLRHDTADQRLTPLGQACGLITSERWKIFQEKLLAIDALRSFAMKTLFEGVPVFDRLRRSKFERQDLPESIWASGTCELWNLLETEAKYAGYIRRQAVQNRQLNAKETQRIPDNLDFDLVRNLRPETRQKLSRVRPLTLGDASRVSGVTPADILTLHLELSKPHG